jgi:uncharacterized membrane protein (DUF485 family)
MQTFSVTQLSMGALFHLGLIGSLGFWMPITLLLGLLALSGMRVVTFNGGYVFGIGGLVTALILGSIFSIGAALAFTLGGKLMGLLGDRLPAIAIRDV